MRIDRQMLWGVQIRDRTQKHVGILWLLSAPEALRSRTQWLAGDPCDGAAPAGGEPLLLQLRLAGHDCDGADVCRLQPCRVGAVEFILCAESAAKDLGMEFLCVSSARLDSTSVNTTLVLATIHVSDIYFGMSTANTSLLFLLLS